MEEIRDRNEPARQPTQSTNETHRSRDERREPGPTSTGRATTADRRAGVFAIGALALALAAAATGARANEPPSAGEAPPGHALAAEPVTEELAEPGSLLLETDHAGLYLPAPRLDTDVHLRVTGQIVRAEVVQRFHNPTEYWVEGVYLFPLPEGAAVDHLDMRIGERTVVGEIHERAEAEQIYERAQRAGQRASLVRQERPNVFRTAVANIGPDQAIEIRIRFQQIAEFDGRRFRLRFPTVVAPRYHREPSPLLLAAGIAEEPITPAAACRTAGESDDAASSEPEIGALQTAGFGALQPGDVQLASTTAITPGDALRLAVPPSHPSFRLTIDLETGFPLREVSSSYHRIDTVELDAGRYGIALAEDAVVPDRDFELVWAPKLDRLPQTTLLTEEFDGDLYALLTMLPPDPEEGGDLRLPRETVFVVDTSGSMAGESLQQARQALHFALERLRPEDSFNIIRFSSGTQSLFPESVAVSPWTLTEARRFIDRLRADGGTEMLPALRTALGGDRGLYPVRQVIFITDGSISNEASLLAEIERRLGDSRLFTVGIGSAPNSYFMRKAAEFGRGTFTFVGFTHEVEPKMTDLFTKLENPVLSDLEVIWPDPAAESWPGRMPDLYIGEPVVVAARLAPGSLVDGTIEIRGRRGGVPWSETHHLPQPRRETGIEKLWARQRIASLMDRYSIGDSPDDIRAAVLQTALDHHLVSRFTSLVAVDTTPTSAPPPEATRPIPLALPAGWSPPFTVGNLPQTGTPSSLLLLLGSLAVAGGALLLLPSLRGGGA